MAKPEPAFRHDLLLSILSQPTSPYREGHVIELLTRTLSEGGVPHFSDPVGNIIVGAASRAEYAAILRERTSEPLRVYIAHLDHPGFHGASWKSATQLEVTWFGGTPTQHLVGASVWLSDSGDFRGNGRVEEVTMHSSGKAIVSGVIEVPSQLRERFADSPKELFGGFSFRQPVWIDGELIYTKAADDLVGSFAIVSLALEHFAKKPRTKKMKNRPPFLGLLTRAEEVGFIGAIGHFELGWLAKAKRPLLGVSLETSRQLPGAEIGKGPVVRLGDRYTVFDSGALRLFTELAAKTLPDRHQRRIMDGGTCEATAATVYGIPCVGISVPLGNYHNQSFEGGPDSRGPLGPAPEFVHMKDVEGLLALCRALLTPKMPWMEPWRDRRKEFKKSLVQARALLRSGP